MTGRQKSNNQIGEDSLELFDHLQCFQFDFEQYKIKKDNNISFIYGDRGSTDHRSVAKKLEWPPNFSETVTCYFVRNSCHLPMLENPVQFYKIMTTILRSRDVDRSGIKSVLVDR